MSVVVDTSITVAWLFRDERTAASQTALRRVVAEGAAVPSLWRLEVANVLRTSIRRGRCTNEYADKCLQRLAQLRITLDSETDRNAWGATRELSVRHNLTPYDAAYLELADRLGGVLATKDRALLEAAQRMGIETLGP